MNNWRLFSSRGFMWAAHVGSGPFGSDTIFIRDRNGLWSDKSNYADVSALKYHEREYDSFTEITSATLKRLHLEELQGQVVLGPKLEQC